MSETFLRRFVGALVLPWLGALLFGLAASGCNPSFDTDGANCTISCPAGVCPSGLMCNSHNFCTVNGIDTCTSMAIDAHGGTIDAVVAPSDAAPPQSSAFVQMSAGPQHLCGITASGELYCWGDNQHGQLGFDSTAANFNFGMPVTTPLLVPQVQGPWAQASAGTTHTCAVTVAKTLYCWGDNTFNEVASNGAKSLPPSQVMANSPSGSQVSWLEVAAGGGFTCARGVDADLSHPRVYCWGENNLGQMGNNIMSAPQPAPMPIGAPGTDFDLADQLSAADRHICAHTSSNNVYCWGSNQDDTNVINGQSLPGATTMKVVLTPTQVPAFDGGGNDITNMSPFTSVSAGDESTCAVLSGSAINCWGSDFDDALGGGPAVNGFQKFVPLPPGQLGNWTAVAVGRDSACAVFKPMPTDEASVVECWGVDNNGNRGTVTPGAPLPSGLPATPSPITSPVGAAVVPAQLVAGNYYACAYNKTDDANSAFCWGDNHRGQMSQPIQQSDPSPLPSSLTEFGFVTLSAGLDHTCALTSIDATGNESQMSCWGLNDKGQVLQVPPKDLVSYRSVNQTVATRNGIVFKHPNLIAVGASHSCIESSESDGELAACWGDDTNQQLPAPPTAPSVYAEVANLGSGGTHPVMQATEMSGGNDFTCVVMKESLPPNQATCWGTLGTVLASPSQPVGTLNAVSSLGITSGAVWGGQTLGGGPEAGYWGNPDMAKFATVETMFTTFGSIVSTDKFAIVATAQGSAPHRCFTDDTGELYCGGPNDSGQIPGALNTDPTTPTDLRATSNLDPLFMGAFKALPDPTSGPQLAVGAHHTCAISSDGTTTGTGNLYCWGDDTFDQLGNHDSTFKVALPAPVAMQVQSQAIISASWVGVAAGDRHTCATLETVDLNGTSTDQLYCWGDGTNGQLGTIDTQGTEPGFQRLPTRIPLLH